MGFIRLSECVAFLLFVLYPHYQHAYDWDIKGKATEFPDADKEIESGIFIEQIKRTWENASRYCTLYGAEKAPSYVSSVQDIPHPIDMDDSLHWVGATAAFTPWLKIVGCYIHASFPGFIFTRRSSVIGPVADCYLQCKSNFGVSETRCFCSWMLEERQVNETCEFVTSSTFHNDVTGTDTQKYSNLKYQIAMYNIHNGTFKIKDNSDECLMDTVTGFSTQPCDSIDSSMRIWTDAIIRGLTPSNGGLRHWTPFIRRRIFMWAKETGSSLKRTECVSVKAVKNKKKYEMVIRPCDERLLSICLKPDGTAFFGILSEFLGGILAIVIVMAVLAALFKGGGVCLQNYIHTMRNAVYVPHPTPSAPRNIKMARNSRAQRTRQRDRHRSTGSGHAFSNRELRTVAPQNIYFSELTKSNEDQTAQNSILRSSNNQYEISSGSTYRHNESERKLLMSNDNVDDTTRNKKTKDRQHPDGLL